MNAVLVVSLTLITFGQDIPRESPQRVIGSEAIERAVRDLGSGDPGKRLLAEQLLLEAGNAARVAIERAAAGNDTTVVDRAKNLLKQLGVAFPIDTPEQITRFVTEIGRSNRDRRRTLMGNVREPKQFLAVLEAAGALRGANERSQLRELLLERRSERTTELFAGGQIDQAEKLLILELDEQHGDDGYLALLAVTGRLPPRIAEAEKELAAGPDVALHRRLILMHRAAGNLPAARVLAEKQTDLELELWLAVEAEDWPAARKIRAMQVNNQGGNPARDVKTVMFARLLKDEILLRDATVALERLASERRGSLWELGEAFLVAEQYDAAAAMWQPNSPSLAFELRCLRLEYDKAFALARVEPGATIDANWYATLPDAKKLEGGYGRRYYALRVVRALWGVGRRDDARRVAKALRSAVEEGREVRDSAVIDVQLIVGDRRQAFADALLGIRSPGQPPEPANAPPPAPNGLPSIGLLMVLYPDRPHHEIATLYAASIGRDPDDSDAVFRRMEQVYYPPARAALSPQERQKLIDELAAAGEDFHDSSRAMEYLVHLSHVSRLLSAEDRAYRFLEHAAAFPRDWRPIGMSIRGDDAWLRRDWPAVVRWMPRNSDGVFPPARESQLAAALFHVGRSEEAVAHLQLGSSIWPLGAASLYQQAEYLAKAGRPREADERFRLALRLLPPGDRTAKYVLQELHHDLKDDLPLSAAEAWRQHMLLAGRSSLDFKLSDYLQSARQLHLEQVRQLLKDGRVREALQESNLAIASAPGDPVLAATLVALFDHAGETAVADDLYERSFKTLDLLVHHYPESAIHRHLLARLSVLSHRSLDNAQTLATQAIAIDANQPDFYGTLAEIELARGNNAAARAAAEAGQRLDPNHAGCAAVLSKTHGS